MDAPPVQYVKTSDGYDIAYAVCGKGQPLVLISPDFRDIRQMWQFSRGWLEGLAQQFMLIQYDPRGQGMSTRRLPDSSTVDDFVKDLEAVTNKARVETFMIWGFAGKSHTAVRFAARNPERVTAMILNSPAVSGQAWGHALYVDLPNEDWEQFLRTQVAAMSVALTRDAIQERVREIQRTQTLDDFNTMVRAVAASNVEDDLRGLTMPVLIMHPRVSFFSADEPIKVAKLCPVARYIALDGDYFSDSVEQVLEATDRFLNEVVQLPARTTSSPPVQPGPGLSPREVDVLRLLTAGKSNQQIADELVISLNTVRRHVSNVFDKTGVANRTEAAVYARDHGIP